MNYMRVIKSNRIWGISAGLCVAMLAVLAACNGLFPIPQPVPGGDRPPRIQITSPTTNITVDAGQPVTIGYEGEDGETAATIRIYVDRDQTPNNGNEIVLRDNIMVGPGVGTGQILWDTTGVTPSTYFVFGVINDGVNAAVTATGLGTVQVVPTGTNPLSNPPALIFLEPEPNLGLSSGDTVTLRYRYRDQDTPVKITLLLDKDLNPTNDDVNNPGDPFGPNTNIIILPSAPRKPDDPVLPPDVPGQPPANIDSIEIRTNPRNFPSTPGGNPLADPTADKLYMFDIDFSQIPVRPDGAPYFFRATIDDGENTPVHVYATGRLTVTGLAAGFVDLRDVGRTVAGAQIQGFSQDERLGTLILDGGDTDNDSINDFMIGGRFASPRNRFQAGGAYLIRGRRKTPFPPDTNGNGRPDQQDSSGNRIDFPLPPPFIAGPFNPAIDNFLGPYQPQHVGRFGGTISINSVGSFYRGITMGMPQAHGSTRPPPALQDPDLPNTNSAGLMSIARLDLTGDGVDDFVFGLPFISDAYEFHDDDPCDGNALYGEGYPNRSCVAPRNDDMVIFRGGSESGPIDQGMVIILSGANDQENDGTANTSAGHTIAADGDGFVFRLFLDAGMAGQFDPDFAIDDEGIIQAGGSVPVGLRLRGGWFGGGLSPPIQSDNEYGATVSRLPSFDNDLIDELLVSVPGHNFGQGRVDVWIGGNFISQTYYSQANDGVRSLPHYFCPDTCVRGLVATPVFVSIFGAAGGDRFGNARPGGQFNQDGTTDVLAGAPDADRSGLIDNGVLYVLFTPAGGFGDADLSTENLPRVEIHGTHNGDRFGEVHDTAGDVNGDGVEDIIFGSPNFDDDILGNPDAGYAGVVFGNRPITGERVFFPEQVGTAQLVGVRFYGATIGARAGAAVSSAGDFNQDGYGDFLIASPGEVRNINGEDRLGVAYLVFGGPHLTNKSFNLSAVGTAQLPGVIFVSPYVRGTADEAPIENVGAIGDVDGDGFADIALGLPRADFIYPPQPNQRRTDAGEVYVIYGSNFGSNRLP